MAALTAPVTEILGISHPSILHLDVASRGKIFNKGNERNTGNVQLLLSVSLLCMN